ncbi:hypothetical protein AZE42_05840 [Rhizopogon vesiculosus]|uniref:Uncharacterized protein n=1 Tax=Rhizopogon vesiculosus TaxID=180088 RepID=A0A1J8QZZ0_9AGAM|nr:hypothetical protein AZE42_05840 [Rhizopogon vesiculosus]
MHSAFVSYVFDIPALALTILVYCILFF